jgi:formylglycine-generating enzyme required for sulfatase activity
LKALLPESGTDIKGHMRSHADLLAASGYASRPKDFEDLLRILDGEIRLITPTDPEGKEEESVSRDAQRSADSAKYYQLTHDYLVPSLREWLVRKQKETRRGRAELLLADRAVVWNARPENRQLPSLWQWFQIKWLTSNKNWTPPQRKMMRKAGRYHALRALAVTVCLTVLGLGGWEGYGRLEGRRLRDRLLESTTADVPGIVKDMAPYRRWLDPLLQESYAQAEKGHDPRKQLHASLALLPVDAGQVEYLLSRLLQGQPQEVLVIREALSPHKQELTERLWILLENSKNDQDERLRAACTLAAFAPDDPRWKQASGDVAAILVIQKTFFLAQWTEALQGVRPWLLPPLADLLMDQGRSVSERSVIGTVYGRYAADTPDAYARLEKGLTETTGPDATPEVKVALAKKQAGIGLALVAMGQGQKVWPLLQHSPDPTRRSYLIEWMGPGGVDARVLTARLEEEKEVSIRRALLLSLGQYGLDRLSQVQRHDLLPRLLHLYEEETDPGLHGAAEWLVRQWQGADQLKALNKKLATGRVQGKRHWYVNKQGQTMIIVPKPGEFWMGEGTERHRRKIDRSFALTSKEVTVEQFRRFRLDHNPSKFDAPTGECPANMVSWYDAAAYCNWLSEQEGIPRDQWCYEPNQEGAYAAGMKMAPNYLKRTGYRLPTEGEWEYGCRAGAVTSYSCGEQVELLGKYAWFNVNSAGTSHPVGAQKPNDLGLFDMHGNAWEWCQDVNHGYGKGADRKDTENLDDISSINSKDSRVLRGGSFINLPSYVRSASRIGSAPASRLSGFGFRPARTFTP